MEVVSLLCGTAAWLVCRLLLALPRPAPPRGAVVWPKPPVLSHTRQTCFEIVCLFAAAVVRRCTSRPAVLGLCRHGKSHCMGHLPVGVCAVAMQLMLCGEPACWHLANGRHVCIFGFAGLLRYQLSASVHVSIRMPRLHCATSRLQLRVFLATCLFGPDQIAVYAPSRWLTLASSNR